MLSTLTVHFCILIFQNNSQKKERALKRQQRQAMLLEGFRNAVRIENGRSRRDRKPVNYTFGMCHLFIYLIGYPLWDAMNGLLNNM